ncbi:MAG: multicopper oxidase domain-containing protein [Bacteroidetes bacterium]|nr:multicopper oxidase domain-containing protein [Bacteroidota bacterium]
MKKIIIIILFHIAWQSLLAQEFDHGNNLQYTPFKNFSIPVATPSSILNPPPVTGYISNQEKDIVNKQIVGANSGIHFPKGTGYIYTKRYDLFITDTVFNFTGKKKHGIAVNGAYPAPTLVATIGDTLLVFVHNKTAKPTAIHWHGLQLPYRMDGVPHLTQHPIPPNSTYIYKFPVVQAGTYWYHSHFALQEQIGLFGAIIFNKRTEPNIPTIPLVLSEWSDTKPEEIDRMLHTANDWFGIKKHASQSYWEAIKAGKFGVKFTNEWKRMHAMDVSDVYYEKFLINGKNSQSFPQFKPGDRVRLRIVNGGSSSYFWLSYSGGKMEVVANDGNDVIPVGADRIIIGPAETYDLIITIPQNMQYEFLATPEDRSGSASVWLGTGMKMQTSKLPKLNYFEGMKMMNDMMKMNGDMKPMGMEMSLQTMDMNAVMYPEMNRNSNAMENMGHDVHDMHQMEDSIENKNRELTGNDTSSDQINTHNSGTAIVTLNYNMLQATKNTTLPEGPWKEFRFELNGNMNRYVWTLNNKTVSETDKILIKQGENIRIILYNNSMMRHPMHLHGHDFRVLNQFGERSPMKNVIDIMPMETDTLEFRASESGDWFFHCHILYHMMSGMGRIFSYANSPANPEIPDPKKDYRMLKKDDRMFHLMFQNDFASNGNDGSLMYGNTRWAFQGEWRLGYNAHHGYEVETHFGRYIGKMQWLFPYIGIDWRYRKHMGPEKNLFGQTDTKNNRKVFHVGVEYTLPWLAVLDASVDHRGNFRVQLMREDIPLTPRLRSSFMVNSDKEWMVGGKYILTKNFALSTHYDSDMGWGAGVTFSY